MLAIILHLRVFSFPSAVSKSRHNMMACCCGVAASQPCLMSTLSIVTDQMLPKPDTASKRYVITALFGGIVGSFGRVRSV